MWPQLHFYSLNEIIKQIINVSLKALCDNSCAIPVNRDKYGKEEHELYICIQNCKVCKKLRQISVFKMFKRLIRKFEHPNYLTHAKMNTNVG